MAKFMLVKFSFMAEITDADALRDAALKKFDADSTSDDYPDTADWHASEEGQGAIDGVPGVKAVPLASSVGPMEGTTQDEARDAWAEREGITWWPEARDAELARQHREGIT